MEVIKKTQLHLVVSLLCEFCGYLPMLTPHIFNIKLLYSLSSLCLNRTLSCVDFMDVIMGDMPDQERSPKGGEGEVRYMS